jgi:hypothetical protein
MSDKTPQIFYMGSCKNSPTMPGWDEYTGVPVLTMEGSMTAHFLIYDGSQALPWWLWPQFNESSMGGVIDITAREPVSADCRHRVDLNWFALLLENTFTASEFYAGKWQMVPEVFAILSSWR